MLGKGGVGKSTVSAALGLAAARTGRRALLVEIAGSDHASAALGADGEPALTPREIADGLWTVTIDVDRSTEEYLASQLPLRPLVDLLVQSKAFHHFTTAAPGLAELVTVGAVWRHAVELDTDEKPVWDLVVVDCPATGHGIALLETAANIRDLAGDGPIHDQAERIERVIRHPAATGIAIVAMPDELPVSEAIDASAALGERSLPVALAILNRTSEVRFRDEEAGALTAATLATDGATQAAATAALHHLDRQTVEAAHAERLVERTGLPLLRLPDLRNGSGELGRVAALADVVHDELWGDGP